MKNILVIGSQGYIGSRLTDYLLRNNLKVSGIDIGYFQYGITYYPQNLNTIQKDAAEITEKDIENFDVVIQLAGISNDPWGKMDAKKIYDPTHDYAIKIAKYCKKLNKKFIYPSSCSVYGISDGLVNENSILNPQTPYSINKVQVEESLKKIADDKFKPIALRLATVFGSSPRLRLDLVINMLVSQAYVNKKIILNSNGEAWRPNVHIEDVCNIILRFINEENLADGLNVYNIGQNNLNVKIIDIAKKICETYTDSTIEFINESKEKENELIKDNKIKNGIDVRTYMVDFTKLKTLFPDYVFKFNLENGIKELYECFSKYQYNSAKIAQRDFYRMQQLEHLQNTNQI